MNLLRYASWAGLMIVTVACSSDDDKTRTRSEFCNDWATAACSGRVVSACQASSADECKITQAAFCLSLVPENFSDESADECLNFVGKAYKDADLTAAELPVVLRLATPCDKVVKGPRGPGDSCGDTRDCNAPGGYVCVLKGEPASGTCEKPEIVGAGRSCAAAAQICEIGFYCDGSHCIETQPAGEPCSSNEYCGEDGYCDADGMCSARLGVNVPCSADTQCLSGLCYTFGEGDQTCTDHLVLSRSEPVCANLR